MLKLTQISKAFVHQSVLNEVTLQVTLQSRIGLIGRNGCGKSTLLKIIMGEVEADSGSIYRAPGLQVACLTQEPRITPGHTLYEEVKSVYADLNALAAEESNLLKQLESLTGDAQMKALHRLDQIHRHMERLDAHQVDAQISRMVNGLGFSLDDLNRPVEQFSGGWQMRINLAKVLLSGADILLLDEPTNHLDLEACEWLEGFLKDYQGGLIIVSHDRRFLDQVVTEIAELEFGHLTSWPGNYTSHLSQKAAWIERESSAVDRQHKELTKQMAFVERFRASATKSTQAKSREKQLNKIERLEAPKTNMQRISVRFPLPQASGKQVLTIRNVSKGYDHKPLFFGVNADVQRRQRIFLLGPNGCGKTTLFKLLLGLETLDAGEVRQGHQAIPGYFSQNQLDTLDPNKTVFETLHDARPEMTQTEIRGLLGRFLFTGDQVFKAVSVLSGGEKSKLALAKLILSGPNTLFLDEPTNHMDIPAKEVLEDAFREYEGTILCISHDRYFIQQLATDIWEIYEGQLIPYSGDYEYYLSKREEIRAARLTATHAKQNPKNKPEVAEIQPESQKIQEKGASSPLRQRRESEKRLNQLEKAIIQLESELSELQERLTDLVTRQAFDDIQAVNHQLEQGQEKLIQLNTEWESLAEILAE